MRSLVLAAAALLVSVASASAQTAPELFVRVGSGAERRVPIVSIETAAGPREYVRLDALAMATGAQVTLRAEGDAARFDLAGASLDVRNGLQYARSGGAEYPLLAGPVRDARGLLVPTQFAVDLLPRLVRTLTYDPSSQTLRSSRATTRVASRTAASTARSAAASSTEQDAAGASAVRLPSIPPRRRVDARSNARTDARPDASVHADVDAEAAGRPRRLVAIDAGHGGPDAGMRGSLPNGTPLLEKDVTLGVARDLRDALIDRGIGVVMTRTTDTLIALGDRGRIANARHADLFVSVHVNAANPGWRDPAAARGFETYFLSDARTEEARQVAERENASTRYEAGPSAGSDPLRYVLTDLAQNAYLRESSRLATDIQERLARVHPGPNRRVHQAGFKVLVTAAMPSVLVEIGFGSNPSDAEYLASAHGRREIAEAIAGAVSEFLVRYARTPAE